MTSRTWPGVLAFIATAALLGCPIDAPEETLEDPGHDWDGDGYCEQDPCMEGAQGGDCDDNDAAIHPGADEGCDGLDNDCDGSLGDAEVDADGDGYTGCDGDCDDARDDVHPGAVEICDGGIDNDCDGLADDVDEDGDGFAPTDCDGEDCDDSDAAVHPEADELCNDGVDNDCDGGPNECGLYGQTDLGGADLVLQGEGANDEAGVALGSGDVDADGYDDVIVGAWYEGAGGYRAGAVYLLYGSPSGTASLDDADAKIIGEDSQDYAGHSADCAGDVDGDGHDDILVGAHGNQGRGAVYVLRGPLYGDIDLSAADAKLTGEAQGDLAGFAVAGAGDVDGDGLDDLLIGAHHEDAGGESAGAAYLVLGTVTGTSSLSSATAKFVGESAGDDAGRSVAAGGDVNADGYGDILIGAYQSDTGSPGRAYLIHGPASGTVTLDAADAVFEGENGDDGAGVSVHSPGDVDGDGYDDILVGAYRHDGGGTDAGIAYLFYGPVSGPVALAAADARLIGEASEDEAGNTVHGGGDLDGDSLPDIAVGAPQESTAAEYAGAVYVIYPQPQGDVPLSTADAKLLGVGENDGAGYALATSGDINGDGYDDLIVGANDASGGGAIYLLFGGGL